MYMLMHHLPAKRFRDVRLFFDPRFPSARRRPPQQTFWGRTFALLGNSVWRIT